MAEEAFETGSDGGEFSELVVCSLEAGAKFGDATSSSPTIPQT